MKHPPDDWRIRLSTIPGVLRVLPGKTPGKAGFVSSETCIIECELGRDLREDLAQFVVNQGVGLLELKPLSLSLEEVFLQLTREDESPFHEPSTT